MSKSKPVTLNDVLTARAKYHNASEHERRACQIKLQAQLDWENACRARSTARKELEGVMSKWADAEEEDNG